MHTEFLCEDIYLYLSNPHFISSIRNAKDSILHAVQALTRGERCLEADTEPKGLRLTVFTLFTILCYLNSFNHVYILLTKKNKK